VENNEVQVPPISQAILEARMIIKSLGIPHGIYDPENPLIFKEEDNGEAPDRIENLESMHINEISAQMNLYTNWSSFVSSRLTEYKQYRDCVELEMTKMVNERLAVNDTTKVTQKRASAKMSVAYGAKEYTYLVLKNVCDMLTTALENSNKIYACLSRHITAIQSDMDRHNRLNNHNKAPVVTTPAKAGRRAQP
jgi:hypothetical protein